MSSDILSISKRKTYTDGSSGTLTAIDTGRAPLDLAATIIELLAHVLLATAKLRGVYSDEQAFDPPLLRMLHDLLRDGSVLVHVPVEALSMRCGLNPKVGWWGHIQLHELHLIGSSCISDFVK